VTLRSLSGEQLGPLRLLCTDTVSDLRAAAREAMGDTGNDSIGLHLVMDGKPLIDDTLTLAEAGFQNEVVLDATRVSMVKIFAMSSWTSLSVPDFRSWPSVRMLHVPRGLAHEVAAAAIQPSGATEAGHPKQLLVAGAGLHFVNGLYVLHRENPLCWKQKGIGGQDVYLRLGTDGNWCLVNNPGSSSVDGSSVDGNAKKYYYVNRETTLTSQAWQPDSDGSVPAPVIHTDAGVPCLLQVGSQAVRVLDGAEELPELPLVASFPRRLHVSKAGLDFVNGVYERYGEDPCWTNQNNYKVYLRKGSDGNWCLVNNRGIAGEHKEKEYYYVSSEARLTVAAWRSDSHGQGSPPLVQEQSCSALEQLYQTINTSGGFGVANGSALVAVPAIPMGCRPLVFHSRHFQDETQIAIVKGGVGCGSFSGYDSDQIDCASQGPGGDVWTYIGK